MPTGTSNLPMDEVTILSPLGNLGYGVVESSIDRARADFDLDIIAIDAGSMDPGPNYLGEGKFFADPGMVERDLRILLSAAQYEGIPLLISSAGGGGCDVQLEQVVDIIDTLAEELDLSFPMSRIYTDVDREYLVQKVEAGETRGLGWDVELDTETIEAADRIVAQVGVEPFVEALDAGAEVVVGGRASDLSPFAAIPIRAGFDPGLTYHLAKILECGARATTQGSGTDALIGIVRDDHFDVVPPNPDLRCSEESVAAHTLYEKSNPNRIAQPTGEIDVTTASFDQIGDRTVRVTGSTFHRAESETVLAEGVTHVGYRTITPAGIRDAFLVEHIEELTDTVHHRVATMADIDPDRYDLQFRRYGYDGVPMTDLDPVTDAIELGIIIDVVGETQAVADTVCGFARSSLLHYPIEGRLNTGGNLAFPYSPSDIQVGRVFNFSVYHLIENADQRDIYRIEHEEVR